MSLCTHCQKSPIPRGGRRYCAGCAPSASRLWKSRHRRQWNADWCADGKPGDPPYLDSWPSREAFRAYFREYMRARRRKQKASGLSPANAVTITTSHETGGSHA